MVLCPVEIPDIRSAWQIARVFNAMDIFVRMQGIREYLWYRRRSAPGWPERVRIRSKTTWIRGWPVLILILGGCNADPASRGPNATTARTAPNASPDAVVRPERPKTHWRPLQSDGLHDTENSALRLLQQPEEALSVLPRAREGNHVDWVVALRSGAIRPRTNIFPETKIKVLDRDVIMEDTAGMPMVRFPHRPHTEWLDCKNCHDRIFKARRGANHVTMGAILQGRFCGQCHGAVAFPLTQCARCHSVSRSRPSVGAPAVKTGQRR